MTTKLIDEKWWVPAPLPACSLVSLALITIGLFSAMTIACEWK